MYIIVFLLNNIYDLYMYSNNRLYGNFLILLDEKVVENIKLFVAINSFYLLDKFTVFLSHFFLPHTFQYH